MEMTDLGNSLLKHCQSLLEKEGLFYDFPGSAKELTKSTIEKARKKKYDLSKLDVLKDLAALVATDKITIGLIKKIQEKQNQNAWERVVSLNYDQLLGFSRRFIEQKGIQLRGDPVEAVHVTFMKAQSKISTFKTSASSLQPWLQIMAKNWIVDEVRKHANKDPYIEELGSSNQFTEGRKFNPVDTGRMGPFTSLRKKDNKEKVNCALKNLTTKSEIIVRSHDGERKSVRQIAKENDLTVDKVKYRLNKAREKLKKMLLGKDF